MRLSMLGLSALAFAAVATPALAQDAPASDFTITGGATITTDYRFRGISQTDKRFAIQGTLGVSHSSGFYIGTWGSSVDQDFLLSNQEIDLYGGYKKTFDGTTVDGGLLYYYYPGSGGATTDFFEPYLNVSHTFGPVSAKVGANYAWKQHGTKSGLTDNERDDSLYTYGELSGGIPGTGVTLTGHLGHSFGPSYLTGPKKEYTDWSVTGAYAWKNLTFSVAYVDTDYAKDLVAITPGRDLANATVVGAISVAF